MSSLQASDQLCLSGKAAIITGASRGIGAKVAIEFARQGANIAIIYHSDFSTTKAQDVASQIRGMGRQAVVIKVELTNIGSGERVITETRRCLNVDKIDILVNNAGSEAPSSSALDFDPMVFETTMNVNVRAPALLVKALLPHIVSQGGRIINMSSTLARLPSPRNLSIYGSSKAALECLTRHWALELAGPYNLTVNAISLGIIETDSTEPYESAVRTRLCALPSAAHRLGVVQDVAPVATFLASENARWINGATISCNGGSLFI